MEKEEAVAKIREASIGINKVSGAIQFTVPHGTKLEDAIRALSTIDLSALAKLPRGCEKCISGHVFGIVEDFNPVIRVKLGQVR